MHQSPNRRGPLGIMTAAYVLIAILVGPILISALITLSAEYLPIALSVVLGLMVQFQSPLSLILSICVVVWLIRREVKRGKALRAELENNPTDDNVDDRADF